MNSQSRPSPAFGAEGQTLRRSLANLDRLEARDTERK